MIGLPRFAMLLMLVVTVLPVSAPAQYMFLDANGNGVNDTADTLNASGSTTIDVWLKTNVNRAGSSMSCPSGGALSIFSYEFLLHTTGGTVSWGAFTNQISAFTNTLGGEVTSSSDFRAARGSSSALSPGTYRLASLVVTVTAGNPFITIVPQSELGETFSTGFDSECLGADFDGTMKLGRDWSDVDGAGNPSLWVNGGTALGPGIGHQEYAHTVKDGAGGAVVVWEDARSGNKDIYVQRLDGRGHPLWATAGLAVVTNAFEQSRPRLSAGENGKVFLSWVDRRNGSKDIYAQLLGPDGVARWTTGGVAVCAASGDQEEQAAVNDGAGGTILAWSDYRSGLSDVYSQRLDSLGAALWTSNGVALVTNGWGQRAADLVPDAAGGAIASWEDGRSGTHTDIYSQRISAQGAVQWAADGVSVCSATGFQGVPKALADGAGGCIVTWQDNRSGTFSGDIYAQRLTGSGSVLWATDGASICSATGNQYAPSIDRDGSTGAVIAWVDTRTATWAIFAQRINTSGSALWATDGVYAGGSTLGLVWDPRVVADGAGGAIVGWWGPQYSGTSTTGLNIYAQRLNQFGSLLWASNGSPICEAVGDQTAVTVVSDANEGVIAAWTDGRAATKAVFAARLTSSGSGYVTAVGETPSVLPQVELLPNRPNPFNPYTTITFSLPAARVIALRIFDMSGRLIRVVDAGWESSGTHTRRWDGKDSRGNQAPSGVYALELVAGTDRVSRKIVLLK